MRAFEYLGNDPERWRSIAEALTYNAGVLTQHRLEHENDRVEYQKKHGIGPVDMEFSGLLLWGYAVECFLKTVYLKRGGRLAAHDRYIGSGGHDLVHWAAKAKFPLTGSQQRILKHLEIMTTWSGRYPIATTPGKTSVGHYWSAPEDDFVLERLIGSLRLEIANCQGASVQTIN